MTQQNLDPGDTFEYGATVPHRSADGKDIWLKAGVVITVRANETDAEVQARASDTVETFLYEKVQEWS